MNASLVVPAYNEEEQIEGLLDHLGSINAFEDIIVVDDGSSDSTESKAVEKISEENLDIYFVSLDENTDKVGAIAVGVGLTSSEKIVLSDADTRIKNPQKVNRLACEMDEKELDGIAFQVNPVNESSLKSKAWSLVQDLQYALGRISHRFTTSEKFRLNGEKKNVRCVAGAGGMYRKDTLVKALERHSGRHAGDDMEITAITQMVEEAKVGYSDELSFESEAPDTYKDLLSQRVRWSRGALQSYNQQKSSYMREILSFSRYGMLSVYELFMSLVAPFLFIFLASVKAMSSPSKFTELMINLYSVELGLTVAGISYSLKKGDIGRKKSLLFIPILPAFRISVFYPSKLIGLYRFFSDKIKIIAGIKEEQQGVEIPSMKVYKPENVGSEDSIQEIDIEAPDSSATSA